MPPTISPAEQLKLSAAIGRIAARQAKRVGRGKFLGARSGHDDELTAVGLSAADIVDGRGLGAALTVNEYEAPGGKCGWLVDVVLVRDGKTWHMTHHGAGPETWRAEDWHEVPPEPEPTPPVPYAPPPRDPDYDDQLAAYRAERQRFEERIANGA